MQGDKFSATWVSHSSIADFLACPRAYFLKNMYKDPKTGHKIKLVSPSLTLGGAIHEVLESLSTLPVEKRFEEPLVEKFERVWKQVGGKQGGFLSADISDQYMRRGIEMLGKVTKNPGPIAKKAVKIKMDLPQFFLSEVENIMLCGKIDWLEYLPDTDSVHIIDFKTGKKEEKSDSLQLPIYYLLTIGCQTRPVTRMSYWYLDLSDTLTDVALPDETEAKEKILRIARQIKLARQLNKFKCPGLNGCLHCKPFEAIINGKAEFVGLDHYSHDSYILPAFDDISQNSEIL